MIYSNKFSIKGKDKVANEDSLLEGATSTGLHYFAIADGLGGRPGGDLASAKALEVVNKTFTSLRKISFNDLYSEISGELKHLADTADLPELATTLTLVTLNEEGVGSIAHVGDCRVYLISEEGISLATKDQTEVQRLIDEGILNEKNAQRYGRRHVLLSALSPKGNYIIQRVSFRLDEGDRLIIASDGFYNVINNDELLDISKSTKQLDDMCISLRNKSEQKKPSDDCSAIFIQFSKQTSAEPELFKADEPKQLSMFNFSKKN